MDVILAFDEIRKLRDLVIPVYFRAVDPLHSPSLIAFSIEVAENVLFTVFPLAC